MIKSITVTNYLGDSLTLDLTKPHLSGFVVRGINGLGPGTSNINTTDLATDDGALFNSARLPSRNIVLSLGFLGKDTIEETRQLSYKYFPIKKQLSLVIKTDTREVGIDGYVEANEPDIFTNNEGATISIVCPRPYFYSAGPVGTSTTEFSGMTALFEFPFSNESLTENLIELGDITPVTEKSVIYEGEDDMGAIITIRAVGEASNISISNNNTDEHMYIDTDKVAALTGAGIDDTDVIVISTVKGKKYVHLLRDGETINILNCLSKNSEWIRLQSGENIISYNAETGITNLRFKIDSQIIYTGV